MRKGGVIAALLYLIVGILLIQPSEASAAEAQKGLLELPNPQHAYSLNDRMELLVDDSGNLSYEEILSPDISRQFKAIHGQIAFGFQSSVHWFRVAVRNETSNDTWIVQMDNPLIEHIQFYSTVEAKPLRGNYPAYEVKLPPGETTAVYFRLATEGEMTIPFKLLDPLTYHDTQTKYYFFFGLYYGLIAIVIVFVLILLFFTRDTAFLYYLIGVVSFGASNFIWNGLERTLFGSDHLKSAVHHLLVYITIWTFFPFFRKILDTRQRFFPADIVMRVFMALCPVATAAWALFYRHGIGPYVSVFELTAVIAIIAVILWCAFKGSRVAVFFSIAMLTTVVFGMPKIMMSYGLFPDNTFANFGMQFGSVVDFLLLCFVLYNRLLLMQREKDRARMELEVRTKLLQNISHDIRAPLAYVLGGVEAFMQRLIHDPERQDRMLNHIHQKVLDVYRYIQELSQLGKLEASAEEEQREIVRFGEWMESLFHEFSSDIEQAGMRCEYRVEPALREVEVHVQKHAIKRVLANLIDNACKYSPKNGTVKLEASLDDRSARVTVGDNGPGIEAEHLPLIFNRLSRLEQTDDKPGQGIGLSIVKEIVDRHGGTVWADSEPGEGSRFYFTIPFRY
ncbi:ATP-binding protein [Cohnella suwonensis]|uniref:histidine kinase n=1 Tax=Cohnella suwonensis TaxID=696072 RepID=A0ABW0M308_9BACL